MQSARVILSILATFAFSLVGLPLQNLIACDKCQQVDQSQTCPTCGACASCSATKPGPREKPFSIRQLGSLIDGVDRLGDALEHSISKGSRALQSSCDQSCDTCVNSSKNNIVWQSNSPVIIAPNASSEMPLQNRSEHSTRATQPSTVKSSDSVGSATKTPSHNNSKNQQSSKSKTQNPIQSEKGDSTPFVDDEGSSPKPQIPIDTKVPGQLEVPAANPAEDYQHDPFKDDVRSLQSKPSVQSAIHQQRRNLPTVKPNAIGNQQQRTARPLALSSNGSQEHEPIRIRVGNTTQRNAALPLVRPASFENRIDPSENTVLPASTIHLPQ